MVRYLALLAAVAFLVAPAQASDPRMLAHARHAIDNLKNVSTTLAETTKRDADILRHLRSAARSLDDWQKNVAVAKAADDIGKAEQLAPRSGEAVKQAVKFAREIIAPALQSPNGADLSRLRAELHARPIEQMRTVVAEELDVLARISTQVADISALLTKAVADASSSTLGGGD